MPATPIAPAERTKNIKYAVRDVLALADEAKARGLDLLHLNIGDPNIYGFSPPAAVAEAAVRAIHDNLNGYAPSDGTTAALSAIREDAEARGVKAIQHIAITSGCSEADEIALSALVNLEPGPGTGPWISALHRHLGQTRVKLPSPTTLTNPTTGNLI